MANVSSSILTKVTQHREPYATISPSRPELSQKGRVVLVTGGSEGIGLAIARSFGEAGAAKVIITGRRRAALEEAVTSLAKASPETVYIAHQQDASDVADIERFWKQLEEEELSVNVLVLNVARITATQGAIVEVGYKEVIADLTTNSHGVVAFSHFFYHQKKRDVKQKLFMVNISTKAIHDFEAAGVYPNYSASKSAGTILVQQIAKGLSPDDMQVLSFHPGAIFTAAAKKAGYTANTLPWDHENLPGHYAVWAASDEAKFLHGRFTWAAWDVDEISNGEIRERIATDANYLKVGVVGI